VHHFVRRHAVFMDGPGLSSANVGEIAKFRILVTPLPPASAAGTEFDTERGSGQGLGGIGRGGERGWAEADELWAPALGCQEHWTVQLRGPGLVDAEVRPVDAAAEHHGRQWGQGGVSAWAGSPEEGRVIHNQRACEAADGRMGNTSFGAHAGRAGDTDAGMRERQGGARAREYEVRYRLFDEGDYKLAVVRVQTQFCFPKRVPRQGRTLFKSRD